MQDADPTPQLRRLYLAYTCKGSRSRLEQLSAAKFIHLLRDAQVLDSTFTQKDADILVSKVLGRCNTMAFPAFCELIGRIAKAKFEDLYSRVSPTAALCAFIKRHIAPLCVTETQEIDRLERQDIPEPCIELLIDASEVLGEMYIRHFPWELHSAESVDTIRKRSEATALSLAVSLNIVPEVLSKSAATLILQTALMSDQMLVQRLHKEDKGSVLTFNRFLLFLAKCALGTGLESDPQVSMALLFEIIEMSPGFQHFEGISSRTHTSRMTLMTPKMLAILDPMLNPEKSSARDLDLATLPIPGEQLDAHLESLEHIFQAYCSYGEPMNTSQLKEFKFLRLLTDAGLISRPEQPAGALTKVQATFIYVKATEHHIVRSGPKGPSFRPQSHLNSRETRMTFHHFLQALGRVAELVSPQLPPDEALLGILETNILKLEGALSGHGLSPEQIRELLHTLREENMQQSLLVLQRCLEPYYQFYSDSKALMTREQFIRFCVDFEVFPDIVSKAKLVQFFVALAFLCKKKALGLTATLSLTRSYTAGLPIDQPSSDVIDLPLFLDGIALCALEGLVPETAPEARVIAVLERMSQSKGPALTQLRKGGTRNTSTASLDFLKVIAEFYPQRTELQTVKSFVGFQEMARPSH